MSLKALSIVRILFSCSIFSSLVISAAINTFARQYLSVPTLNASSLDTYGVPVDPRFGLQTFFPEDAIDQTSSIMVAINAMADLTRVGLQVWFLSKPISPKVSSGRNCRKSDLPATGIDQKILIWGLDTALYNMIVRVEFFEVIFYLLWSGRVVGTIDIFQRRSYLAPPLTVGAGPSNLTLDISSPLDNVTNVAVKGAYGDTPHFELSLLDNQNPLDRMDVYTIIMATLKHVAVFPAISNVLDTFQVGPVPGKVVKTLITGEHGRRLPRRAPPFLENEYIIAALRAVPEWMLVLVHSSQTRLQLDFEPTISIRKYNGRACSNNAAKHWETTTPLYQCL